MTDFYFFAHLLFTKGEIRISELLWVDAENTGRIWTKQPALAKKGIRQKLSTGAVFANPAEKNKS